MSLLFLLETWRRGRRSLGKLQGGEVEVVQLAGVDLRRRSGEVGPQWWKGGEGSSKTLVERERGKRERGGRRFPGVVHSN